MDGVDPRLVDVAEAELAAAPGVLAVRRVRMRWVGMTWARSNAVGGIGVDDGRGQFGDRVAELVLGGARPPARRGAGPAAPRS